MARTDMVKREVSLISGYKAIIIIIIIIVIIIIIIIIII